MDLPICRTCSTKHRLGAMYCPALKSSGGKPEEGLKEVTLPSTAPHSSLSGKQTSAGTGSAGVFGSIPNASTKSPKGEKNEAAPRLDHSPEPLPVLPEQVQQKERWQRKQKSREDGGANEGQTGNSPRDEPVKREFRRPLAKDADKTISRQAPWKAEGMSRATWYRRRAKK